MRGRPQQPTKSDNRWRANSSSPLTWPPGVTLNYGKPSAFFMNDSRNTKKASTALGIALAGSNDGRLQVIVTLRLLREIHLGMSGILRPHRASAEIGRRAVIWIAAVVMTTGARL